MVIFSWKKRGTVVVRKILYGLVVVLLTASVCLGEDYNNFARYRVILIRKPFGKEPARMPDNNKTPPSPPPQQTWLRYLKMRAIIDMGSMGIRVGFENIRTKAQYLVNIGDEIEDGVYLTDADYPREGAEVRKGKEKQWIYMDGTSGAKKSGSSSKRTSTVSRPSGGSFARVLRKPLTKKEYNASKEIRPAPMSPRRQLAKSRGAVVPDDLTGPELEWYLQEYQKELIRAGGELGPALPIPLTPEADAQLVAEGYLPAHE